MTALAPATDLADALHRAFGFNEFRPLQQEAVQAAVDGQDVLVVMPTGAGKSLCFQLPAVLSDGLTLIISPLVALMRDQVDALRRRPAFAEIGSACLTSLQSSDEQRAVLDQLRAGRLRLLYVAPERFRSPAFVEALRATKIARFVVDEAHCISEWGHDFRPDYLALRPVIESLGEPPILAVTATATRRVQQSITTNLGMRDPVVLAGGFNRPNLHFAVHRCQTERDRLTKLERALPKLSALGGSGLIYAATRKQCEEVFELADAALAPLGKRAGMYHAGLDADLRNEMQRDWLSGERQVLVATNAFGMGIDKPDVRFVVHCACPDSIESYYQEAGRAGRDGRKSRCVILYHFSDRRTRQWFIDNEALSVGDVQAAFRELAALTPAPLVPHSADPLPRLGEGGRGSARPGEGLPTLRLPKSWARQSLDWSDIKTRLALGELERAGLIQVLGQTGEEVSVRLLQRAFPGAALGRIRQDLQRQRAERLRRLDEIVDYCKTDACRRRTVLDYFGDRQEPPPTTFCCDNCDNPPSAGAERPGGEGGGAARRAQTGGGRPAARTYVPMPAEIAPGDLHGLLQGIDALRPQVGKSRLNQLLRGASAKAIQRFRDANCPLLGVLRHASESQVDALLTTLTDHGLLRQGDEDEYFVCAVTEAGREVWQDRRPLARDLPGLTPPASRGRSASEAFTLDADGDALLDALKRWRRATAQEEALPPYCVFGDKTLVQIAALRPQTDDELLAVSGVGPAKIERYGAAVLSVIAEAAE